MCSGHKIGTFPASPDLKHAKPDSVLSPPRAITLTSANFTPLVSLGLGLCVFWTKHFDLLLLACLCKTQSASKSNASLVSCFCPPDSHPKYRCACGSPETCFQGSCLGQLLHWYNTAARSTLQTTCHPVFFGFIWWKLGVMWFGFLGLFVFLVGYFFLFYFLPMKRSRGNVEKQVKEEELVLKLCLLLSLVYRVFLQGSVLTAAETTHISVDFTYFQKERLKGGHLAPQDPACLPDAYFTACGLKRRKQVPATRSTFGRQPALLRMQKHSRPRVWFCLTSREAVHIERERGTRENSGSIFILWNPKGVLFSSQNSLAPTLSKSRLATETSMRDGAFAFYKVSKRPDRGDMNRHECLWQWSLFW